MSQQDLQQSIANLIIQITQLLQSTQPLLAQGGAAPPAAATASQPVTLVLTLGTTNPDQLIDFSTRSGQALYDAGRAKLMDEEHEKFDLKVIQVVRFQEMLQSRSETMGWANLYQVISMYQVNERNYDLISEYGGIPHDAIKDQSRV